MSIQTTRTVSDYEGVARALDRGESVELTSSSAYSGRKVVAEERVATLEAQLAVAVEALEKIARYDDASAERRAREALAKLRGPR